jgi:urea transport system permease protein
VLIRFLISLFLMVTVESVHALNADQVRSITLGETDARIESLNQVIVAADPATVELLQALVQGEVQFEGQTVLIVKDGKATDPITGVNVTLPANAQEVISNNRLRGEYETALASLKLFSKSVLDRSQAVASLLKDPDENKLSLIDKALLAESDSSLKAQLTLARAAALLGSVDASVRKQAAKQLGFSKDPATQLLLNDRLKVETEAPVKTQLQLALNQVQSSLAFGERFAVVFTGISLGSILLLAALGLAITYGLMGVINMAHGELIMIGAYGTYLVQVLFRQYIPQAFDWYLLAALPVAFGASALVGAAMERTVIRFLYGRPLETLLATWGISLILMQAVRTVFGAQNVGVENPSWMSGSLAVLPSLNLPYNRLIIIGFAVFVLVSVALLISKTRLGLFVRGVTQNRAIAACMGVNTARIDTYAFALGSGIAGVAGCALSQIGNVGPDLGQGYIVDSFMVVVLGGVGQLAGTVYAALGLGVINKLLEGMAGAVLAKIAVLVFIIIFIQKRPQGIFAMKGRSAES